MRTKFYSILLTLGLLICSLFANSATYYWVGGSGNWSDHNIHWATTSGGSVFHFQVPTEFDDVIFDANSFTANGQTVILNVHGYCKTMDWRQTTYNVNFAGTKDLLVYASLYFYNGLTTNLSGTVYFHSTTTGNIVNTCGKKIGYANFLGQSTNTGGWTLGSYFEVANTLYFNAGTFNSGGYNIKCYIFESYYDKPKSLDFTGTSFIDVNQQWRIYPNKTTNLNMGNATIRYTCTYDYCYFYGGNKTYHDIIVNYSASNYGSFQFVNSNKYRDITINTSASASAAFNFYDTNTIRDLIFNTSSVSRLSFQKYSTFRNVTLNYSMNSTTFTNPRFEIYGSIMNKLNVKIPGTVTPDIFLNNINIIDTIDLAPGTNLICQNSKTQIFKYMVLNGSCSRNIKIFSNTNAYSNYVATISVVSGTINAEWIRLKNMVATGGATFNANNSMNLGNVTGWNITSNAPSSYYWVGGTGMWNDPNHWSTSSGGTSGVCGVPTRYDDVYFDANSFTASGQSVTINIESECKSMSWTGALFTPAFIFIQPMSIFGSLTFISGMNVSGTANLFFENHGTTNYIDLAGKTLTCSIIYFNNLLANSSSWVLNNDFKSSSYISFLKGDLISNGYNWVSRSFSSVPQYNQARNINFSGTTFIDLKVQWDLNISTGSSFNIGTATIRFNSSEAQVYFYGGNQIYNDILVSINYPSYSYFNYSGNNTVRDLNIQCNGSLQGSFSGNSSFRNLNVALIYSTPYTTRPAITFSGINTFNTLTVNQTGSRDPIIRFNNDNTIGTFNVDAGFELTIGSNKIQTITDSLNLKGNCNQSITINSTTAGVAGKFSCSTATSVNADYLKIKDNIAFGGATFTAYHSIDQGNVSGWNVIAKPPLNYYWIGGTGNWSDPNHWALSSGGVSNGCGIPTYQDNVFFDVNSFTGSSQEVTVDVNAECNSMIWNGVTGVPKLRSVNQTPILRIYGSMILDPAMNVIYVGSIYFESTNSGNTIKTYNYQLYKVYFNGSGTSTGVWDLQSTLKISNEIYFRRGTLNTNGFDIYASIFDANSPDPITLNLFGNGTIYIKCAWSIRTSVSTSLNIDNYTINIDGSNSYSNYAFYGGDKAYNKVVLSHALLNSSDNQIYGNNIIKYMNISLSGNQKVIFYGNNTFNDVQFNFLNTTSGNAIVNFNGKNTFNDVSFASIGSYGPYIYLNQNNTFNSLTFAGVGTRIYMGAGDTQKVSNFMALGSGGFPVFLQSTTQGTQATISQATGQVCLDFIWLEDIKATGGAGFNAGASSTDLGNNTNWTFSSCNAYYWVGGSGNWSDLNHWATSSGGTFKQVSLPTEDDDVFFDGNSFSATGQTVNINIADPRCKDMSWLSSLYNPTLAGSSQVNIYGSLYLISGMDVTFTGNFNMKSNSTGEEINTAGKIISNMNLLGNGEWTLQNNLLISNSLNLCSGSLLTNGKDVNVKYFNILTSNTRSLNLGSSKVTVTSGVWNVADNTNLSFNKGSSEIIITAENFTSNFYGNGLTYNNVTFKTNSILHSSLTGSNTFNVLNLGAGLNLSMQPTTQNTTNLIIEGNCSRNVNIQSSTAGTQATFSQPNGTVSAKFVNLKDNSATGGATFNANLSTNNGNVSGWSFTSQPVFAYNVVTTLPKCPTLNDGTASVVITTGTPPYTYKWSTSETSDAISGLIPGNYYVIVADANGCQEIKYFTILRPPSLVVMVNSTDALCYGSSTGTATLTILGGMSPFTYNWSTGATSSSVNNLAAGNHSVIVTDAYNCSRAANFSISEPTQLTAQIITPGSICLNDPASQFTSTTTGGSPGYSYSWSFGDGSTSTLEDPTYAYTRTGNFKVTFEATDVNGCKVSTFNFIDVKQCNQAPVAVCKNVTIEVGSNCTALLTATDIDGGSYDPDQGQTLVYSLSNSGPFAVGQYQVVLTVTDPFNLSSSCTSTVKVVDNIPPIAKTKNITVQLDARGNVIITAAQIDDGSSDNCSIASMSLNKVQFNCSDVGDNSVTFSVTDVNGNIATANATVTVEDNIAPVVSTKNNTVYLDKNGAASITPSDVNNGIIENCGLASLLVSPNTFSCSNTGDNTVTLTAEDVNGNISSNTAIVTVIDNTSPTISCVADQARCANLFSTNSYIVSGTEFDLTTKSDNCSIASVTYNQNNLSTLDGATFVTGNTTVTWTVVDASGNTSTCSFVVTINPLPVASISTKGTDEWCNGVVLTASGSTFTSGNTYLWSTNETSESIVLSITTSNSGNYTVFVTDPNGCVSPVPSVYTYSPHNLPSSYTLLGFKEVKLGENDKVLNGSIGVMNAGGQAHIGKDDIINGNGSFIKADSIVVHPTATVPTLFKSKAVFALPTMKYYNASSGIYSAIVVKKGTTQTINSDYVSVKIESGAKAILNGTIFGDIELAEGATVLFNSNNIQLLNLKVASVSKSRVISKVGFADACEVRVKETISLDGMVTVNEDEYKVIFYIGNGTSTGKQELNIKSDQVLFFGSVYVPNGQIEVYGAPKATVETHMKGFFIAETIKSNGKNVIWNWYDCNPVQNNVKQKLEAEITDENVSSEGNMHLKVYPNPFTDQAIVEFGTTITENISVELYNILGDRLDVLFTGEVEEGISQQVNLSSASLSNGFYYVRMTKGTETIVQKVILNR